MYSLVDLAGTLFFIIAWLWLRKFESKEARVLNRNSVTASDYTLRITTIPDDTLEEELAEHFEQLTGHMVAAVNLAFNNSKEIGLYIKRGVTMEQRYKCVQRIRYEKTNASEKKGHKKRLRRLMRERDDLTMRVRKRDEERHRAVRNNQKAIEAFVTFQTEEGFVEAMLQYNLNWFQSHCCCYPEKLRFKGMKLKVKQAPDPSTIIWENLEFSNRARFFRKCITTGVALLAVLLSVLMTFTARDFKTTVLEAASKPCPEGFFDQDPSYQLELVNYDIRLAHCYCSTLGYAGQWNIHQCHDHIKDQSKATATSYSAGVIVVVMNTFFTLLMDRAGHFERHQSLNQMETSNMVRVFMLKFVNSGCLVLLYGQKWLQKLVGIYFEEASDFNVDWYSTGGSSLIIFMFLNVFAPHVGSFVAYFRHRAKIRKLERSLTKDKETDNSNKIW